MLSELQQLLMLPPLKPTIACWQLRLNEIVLDDKYCMLQPPHPTLHPPSTPAALRQLEGELDPQLDLDHCVVAVGDQPPWLPSLLQLAPLLQLRPSELQQLLMPPLIKPTIACWQLRLNETVLEDKYPMLQPPHPALHPPSTPAALRQLEGELVDDPGLLEIPLAPAVAPRRGAG